MKNSTKLIAIALVMTALFKTEVKAQTSTTVPWRFDVGLDAGFTTGAFRSMASTVLGGTGRLQYNLNENSSLMLTSGYYYFGVTANTNTYTTLGSVTYITPALSQAVIPVKLGYKRFLVPEFYAALEGGVGFETQYSENKKIIVSPSIGWQGDSFDIGLRYETLAGQGFTYGLIGVRLAYGLGF